MVKVQKISKVEVGKELAADYMLYSYSIFNRALPHIVDGLKTAQRRIILGMADLGLKPDGAFKKVSRLEGHVLGLYHPQGGCASTAINMGQADTFRYPLTNIHGNVGGSIQSGKALGKTISDDPPAAARYLEVKATPLTSDIFISEMDKVSHEWIDNYDGSTQEIVHFIPALPTLLINGSVGIASGYACKHLPYNLSEVCNGVIETIQNPECDLSKIILGPDFPGGARILKNGIAEVISTGSGAIEVYGDWKITQTTYGTGRKQTRDMIVVTDLAVGSAEKFLEKTRDALEAEKFDGVADITDLSCKDAIEIQVILKKGAEPDKVLAGLLQHTNLYCKVSANAVGMRGHLPEQLSVKDIILTWYAARQDCLKKKFRHAVEKNLLRLEILDGLIIICDNLDEAIALIRSSKDKSTAVAGLIKRFKLSQAQAQAVMSMTLSQLVKSEKAQLLAEKKSLLSQNKKLNELIQKKKSLDEYIVAELEKIRDLYGDERRTKILKSLPSVKKIQQSVARQKSKSAKPQSTLDKIKSEAKSVGITRRVLNEFIEQCKSDGTTVTKAWPHFKQYYIEFTSPAGKRERRNKVAGLKQKAYEAGMPRRGKNSFSNFYENHKNLIYDDLVKELKRLYTIN